MNDFVKTMVNGRAMWVHLPTGKTLPVVAGGDGPEPPPEDPKPFTPITSQEDLNRVLAERLNRERTKFADYDELKAKADQFDVLEQASKSELDKALDRAARAETAAEEAKQTALRARIQATHQISDEDAELFLTGTDEATLTRQAERLAGRSEDRKRDGLYLRNEGTPPKRQPEDQLRAATRQLFGRGAT